MSHPDFPVRTAPPTRHAAHPDIDEALIDTMVETFYQRIRDDAQLGPIFNGKLDGRWPMHLAKMKDFWSSVMLTTGRYKGRPMQVHMAMVKDVSPQDFSRWLVLFRETAQEVCSPDVAAVFIDRAERVAKSFQLGMFFQDKIATSDSFSNGDLVEK